MSTQFSKTNLNLEIVTLPYKNYFANHEIWNKIIKIDSFEQKFK